MLPKTIACTFTAVPLRPVMRSMRRYSIALLPFHELNTALMESINCFLASCGKSSPTCFL